MLPDIRNDNLHATPTGNDNDDNDVLRMTDIVLLRYVSEGIMQSGTLAVDFEYSSSLYSINYLDVQYSDPDIRKHVVGNPNVLRNIDSYKLT